MVVVVRVGTEAPPNRLSAVMQQRLPLVVAVVVMLVVGGVA